MEVAAQIATGFFGQRPTTLTELKGLGSVNRIFVAEQGGERVIVRLPLPDDKARAEAFYAKEAWCLSQVSTLGIPSPHVLARGIHDSWAYQIQGFVEGTPGAQDSTELWQHLGSYARRFHALSHDGFGEMLPDFFSGDGLARWHGFIDYNVASLTHDDRLLTLGVYADHEQAELHARFAALHSRSVRLGLCHGDLAPRNTLRTPEGTLILLDWGCAEAHLVPHYDLLQVPAAYRPAFCDGYGLSAEACGTILAELTDIALLKSFDLVRWAIDRCPARLDALATAAQQCWATVKGQNL